MGLRFQREFDRFGVGEVECVVIFAVGVEIFAVGIIGLLVVGPGFGFYNLKAKLSRNVDDETKSQLFEGLEEIVTEKFPGMNVVFSDEEIESDGTMRTSSWGYRYLVHIGFLF